MNIRPGRAKTILGLMLLTVGGAGIAHAGCGVEPQQQAPTGPAATARAMTALYQPATSPGLQLLRVHDQDEHGDIVGLWKFEMLSRSTATNGNPMPDGTLIDFGTAAWHADGTELLNSGSRNPADGNFCQGVWERTGPGAYKLNHYALSYMNGLYTGPANIRMRVTLDRSGRTYSGTFTLVQYAAQVVPGHEFDETTPLITITGTVKGTRVTP